MAEVELSPATGEVEEDPPVCPVRAVNAHRLGALWACPHGKRAAECDVCLGTETANPIFDGGKAGADVAADAALEEKKESGGGPQNSAPLLQKPAGHGRKDSRDVKGPKRKGSSLKRSGSLHDLTKSFSAGVSTFSQMRSSGGTVIKGNHDGEHTRVCCFKLKTAS